jgi:hypothetical protein
MVLLQVGTIDRALQALTPRAHGPDGKFIAGDLDRATRLLQKRLVPASWFKTPRSHKHPAFHHHCPNADEPMWLHAGSEANDHAFPDGRQDVVRESSPRLHTCPHVINLRLSF